MKKLALRKESLSELSSDQLRDLAGAAPDAGSSPCTINVSANTCVCTIIAMRDLNLPPCNVVVSENSCVC